MRIFDLHCDTIDRLGMLDNEFYRELVPTDVRRDGTLATNDVSIALDRMVGAQGERIPWCQCFAVWVPDECDVEHARTFYDEASSWFKGQMANHNALVEQAFGAHDIERIIDEGKVAAILTLENGLPIGGDLGYIDKLAQDGVRMVTLTWNGENCIGAGKRFPSQGLTDFGREAVRALENRKIVVDVSHLNDTGFWDLMKVARRPLAASHSNARPLCGAPRNLTDDQFRAIRDMGGIVGLNFYRGFIAQRFAEADSGLLAPGREEVSIDELLAHVEHFLDLGGEDVVALGSDWDGSDVPSWLAGVQDMPSFAAHIQSRFGDVLAEKILFGNAQDFFVRNETA